MGLPKTIRLEDELEEKVEKYLDSNGIKFAQLVNLAVEKFINEPQTIKLAPVDEKDFAKAAGKAFKKHRNAMERGLDLSIGQNYVWINVALMSQTTNNQQTRSFARTSMSAYDTNRKYPNSNGENSYGIARSQALQL